MMKLIASIDRLVFVAFCALCCCRRVTRSQTRPAQTIDQMIEALGGQTFLDVKTSTRPAGSLVSPR